MQTSPPFVAFVADTLITTHESVLSVLDRKEAGET